MAGDDFTVSTVGSSAPLTLTFTLHLNSARSCDEQTYHLSFGDSTEQDFTVPQGTCTDTTQTTRHTYTTAGAYNATLSQDVLDTGQTASAYSALFAAGSKGGTYRKSVKTTTIVVTGTTTTTTTTTPASCTFNGQTIASGSSVTAYQASSVPSGSQCVSQIRTCTNGVLSGSYQYATCLVAITAPSTAVSITSYPDFSNLCYAFVTGYSSGQNVLSHYGPTCTVQSNGSPLLYSVTQEDDTSRHATSANYSPGRTLFMNDYDYATDYGQWLGANFYPNGTTSVFGMSLDTLNFTKTNVTGWPIQYGHMFFGLNDLSIGNSQISLDKNITIEFDMRIRGDDVGSYANKFSGHRIMVGTRFDWPEASRSNTVHFFEMDMAQTPGYSRHYGDPYYPLCQDIAYDRCFYDPNGTYAEGRYVPAASITGMAPTFAIDQWVHEKMPLSTYVKNLHWVTAPTSWSQAKLMGLYLGIESTGATRYWMEVRNYQVYYTP